MMMLLFAWLATAAQITAFKVTMLPIYDAQGVQIETLGKAELPPVPLDVEGTNEFGYLKVRVNNREVFLRPADVRHNLVYCAGNEEARRGANEQLAGAKPGGVRKGAAEGSSICIPK